MKRSGQKRDFRAVSVGVDARNNKSKLLRALTNTGFLHAPLRLPDSTAQKSPRHRIVEYLIWKCGFELLRPLFSGQGANIR